MAQQAPHGGMEFLAILDIEAEPERVFKVCGRLIRDDRFLLPAC